MGPSKGPNAACASHRHNAPLTRLLPSRGKLTFFAVKLREKNRAENFFRHIGPIHLLSLSPSLQLCPRHPPIFIGLPSACGKEGAGLSSALVPRLQLGLSSGNHFRPPHPDGPAPGSADGSQTAHHLFSPSGPTTDFFSSRFILRTGYKKIKMVFLSLFSAFSLFFLT